jgi:hypothetical protein
VPEYSLEAFFKGGRAMERLRLFATNKGLNIRFLDLPLQLFKRVQYSQGTGLTANNIHELSRLHKEFADKEFAEITNLGDRVAMFLGVLTADGRRFNTPRLPLDEVLIVE